jgi:predicted extracellular nuclease
VQASCWFKFKFFDTFKMMLKAASLFLAAVGAVQALTIAEINGNKFLSPYSGQSVTGITGLVTAKSSSGIWIRSTTPDNDVKTSESLYVYSTTVGANLTVGDIITLDGKVSEYRSTATYLYLTELASPKNVVKVSSGNKVTPLVIGQDTPSPPTSQYTSLDGGDIFAVPNGVANISTVNPVLDPATYGLDFWESLSGELVTVKNVTVVTRPNSYRETWVVGGWAATGRNAHGGVTMSDKDANPENILIGTPLDGTKNPTTAKMGDQAADITGIVQQQFGFYYILPLTALNITTPASATPIPVSFASNKTCRAITIGDWNVENMAPTSSHISKVATHIVNTLGAPDLMFIQEIQDNTGATDDGVVDANTTLTKLVTTIKTLSNITYSFVDIDPVNDQDGGQPGGNIRVAYIYRPDIVSLYNPNPGSSTDANEVLPGPALKYNPGRLSPDSPAWTVTRKPLVAAWKAKGSKRPFFTVNVHWSSKGGGTSYQGDVRPPINGVVDARKAQAEVTSAFIAKILAEDPAAAVIASGDFNEFSFVQPLKTFVAASGLTDLDEVVARPIEERYT